MSDLEDIKRIIQGQHAIAGWEALGPMDEGGADRLQVYPSPADVVIETFTELALTGLEVTLVFNKQGQLVGGYNWKE